MPSTTSSWTLLVLYSFFILLAQRLEAGPPRRLEAREVKCQGARPCLGGKTWKGKSLVPVPKITYMGSSEHLREGKRYYGHIAAGLVAIEVSGGYYLNPDLLTELRYVQISDLLAGSSWKLSGSILHYLDNPILGDSTLYGRLGLATRVGTTTTLNDYVVRPGSKQRVSDFGLELAMGHRWQ